MAEKNIGAVKGVVDSVLGGLNSAKVEPFSPDFTSNYIGINTATIPEAKLSSLIAELRRNGYTVEQQQTRLVIK